MSDATQYYAINAEVSVLERQGTVYLIPMWSPAIRLNSTASALWSIIAEHRDANAVVQAFTAVRNVSVERARAFVGATLEQLAGREVIRWVEG